MLPIFPSSRMEGPLTPIEEVKRKLLEFPSHDPPKEPIKADDVWINVHEKLLHAGLDWKLSRGLMSHYYVLPEGKLPGCGGVAGVDYADSDDTLRMMAVRYFGWKGDEITQRLLEDEANLLGGRRRRR